MRVKVGLATSSGSAAPRPCTMPFARVVFPAPRLPINNTTARAGSWPASRSPSAMVSASDPVRYRGTRLQGPRQVPQNVRRDEALLADLARADFGREPSEVHRRRNRLVGPVGELGEQPGDHAGQDVARTAGTKRGRAGGI